MGAPKTGNVRNVVLVGQGGVGKDFARRAMLPPFRQDRPPGRPRQHQAHARL